MDKGESLLGPTRLRSVTRSVSIAICAFACFSPAFGASAFAGEALESYPAPAYQVLRQNEDWSFLASYEGEGDRFDSIKYIPLSENGKTWLSLGGQENPFGNSRRSSLNG